MSAGTIAAAVLAIPLAFGAVATANYYDNQNVGVVEQPEADPTVKIMIQQEMPADPEKHTPARTVDLGYGSGAHLGNGYFLTAAHVAEGNYRLVAIDTNGTKHVLDKVVVNTKYDFAILHTTDTVQSIGTVDLTDRVPAPGEDVVAMGYPSDYSLLTIKGSVMGDISHKFARQWPDLIPLHITAAPGISGGPIFDKYGKVFGVFVSGESPWGGTGLVVPVSDIYKVYGKQFVTAIDANN